MTKTIQGERAREDGGGGGEGWERIVVGCMGADLTEYSYSTLCCHQLFPYELNLLLLTSKLCL